MSVVPPLACTMAGSSAVAVLMRPLAVSALCFMAGTACCLQPYRLHWVHDMYMAVLVVIATSSAKKCYVSTWWSTQSDPRCSNLVYHGLPVGTWV